MAVLRGPHDLGRTWYVGADVPIQSRAMQVSKGRLLVRNCRLTAPRPKVGLRWQPTFAAGTWTAATSLMPPFALTHRVAVDGLKAFVWAGTFDDEAQCEDTRPAVAVNVR